MKKHLMNVVALQVNDRASGKAGPIGYMFWSFRPQKNTKSFNQTLVNGGDTS
jgi:hypothetical protein